MKYKLVIYRRKGKKIIMYLNNKEMYDKFYAMLESGSKTIKFYNVILSVDDFLFGELISIK